MGSPIHVKFYCPACAGLKRPRNTLLSDIQPTAASNMWTGKCPRHTRRQLVRWDAPQSGEQSIWAVG